MSNLPPIKLHYWNEQNNFGDQMSPFIVSQVSGREVEWAPPHKAELYAVGSLAGNGAELPEARYWGTGIQNPQAAYKNGVSCNGTAFVRGPITGEIFKQLGVKDVETIGDPALLLRDLYEPKPIPNVGEFWMHHWSKEAHTEHWTHYVDMIANASVVFSSSLHGLIVADAYGVPNAWRPRIHMCKIKFFDYFLSQGRPSNEEVFTPSRSNLAVVTSRIKESFPL